MLGLADLHRGRPGPVLPGLDPPEHRRTRGDDRVTSDDRTRGERRPGADRRAAFDGDLADVDVVAVDPPSGDVDLGFDGRAVPDREQSGHRWDGVQVDAAPDRRPESPREVDHPRRTGQVGGTAGVEESLGHPQPDVDAPAPRMNARSDPGEEHPRTERRDAHATGRGDEDQERREQDPPVDLDQPLDRAIHPVGDEQRHVVRHAEPCGPLQSGERRQRDGQQELRQPGRAWGRFDEAFIDARRRAAGVEHLGHGPEARTVVEIGHRDVGVAFPDRGDELGRGQ